MPLVRVASDADPACELQPGALLGEHKDWILLFDE